MPTEWPLGPSEPEAESPSTSEHEIYNPDTAGPPTRVRVTSGAVSDVGKVRRRNEDRFLVTKLCKSMQVEETNLEGHSGKEYAQDVGHLMVVADGMGGAAGGAEASQLAVDSIDDFMLNTVRWFLQLGKGDGDDVEIKTEFREALRRADHEVIRRAAEDPRLEGMGTTLTMAYCFGPNLFLAHAGDSRAYLFHHGQLDQITRDHTLVGLMVDSGMISPEQGRTHPRRNVVTNVIGGPQEGVYAEFHKLRVEEGDLLLLCTDGLTEPVDSDAIVEALASHRDDPKAAARRLIDLALEAGARDNVTAIVSRFDFVPRDERPAKC